MKGLLADKVPLEGSEGHEMRSAIDIKAGLMGMTDEEMVCYSDSPSFLPDLC